MDELVSGEVPRETPPRAPASVDVSRETPDDDTPIATAAATAVRVMGRFGEAKELVGAAVFLASQRASSFVTGTDIRVDGGFLCQTI